jgi:hypothetical protein
VGIKIAYQQKEKNVPRDEFSLQIHKELSFLLSKLSAMQFCSLHQETSRGDMKNYPVHSSP